MSSKGKATRRRYYPLLYASLGWGLPAGYTGGRCIELGDEPPIVCCVNCNFGTNCVTDSGKFNYRMLDRIVFSLFNVSKMTRVDLCKMKMWKTRKRTRYRRGQIKLWNGPVGLKMEASPGRSLRRKSVPAGEVGVFCAEFTYSHRSLDRWTNKQLDKLLKFSPPSKIPWNLYYVHVGQQMALHDPGESQCMRRRMVKRRSLFEFYSDYRRKGLKKSVVWSVTSTRPCLPPTLDILGNSL